MQLLSTDRSRGEETPRAVASRRWLGAAWTLVVVFIVAGIFGRSLWKADEPYSFGIVWEMLEDGRWLIPHIAGQPFVEKPPLVYWVAAAFAKAMPFSTPDEGARGAVLLFAAIGFGALYATLRSLQCEVGTWVACVRRGATRDSVAAMSRDPHAYATLGLLVAAGTVGFVEHVHKLTADVGQLAGAIVALWGLVLVATRADRDGERAAAGRRRDVAAGTLLGTGAGIAFLSKGLFVPAVLVATCAFSLLLPALRRRGARISFATAIVAALPWLLIWPALMHETAPQLFDEWLWDNNVGRFLGFTRLGGNGRSIADRIGSILAAGFPATLLLAGLAGYTWRAVGQPRAHALRQMVERMPAHACVLAFLVVGIASLMLSASMRDIYVLPVLPAMVALGLPMLLVPFSLSTAGRRVATALFCAVAATCAALWLALVTRGDLTGLPLAAALVGRLLPLSYRLAASGTAMAIAAAVVVAWAIVIARDELRSATVAWCSGFAMTWSLAAALLLPWIDATHSYRDAFAAIAPRLAQSKTCVGSLNLGESELSMLEYLTGIEATRAYLGHSGSGERGRPNPAVDACDWLLALSRGRADGAPPDERRWRPVMSVSRRGIRDERITLYRAPEREAAPWNAP